MAISNKDRISRGLDDLRDGLTPFVEREFEARLGPDWQARVNDSRRFDIPVDENGAFVWDSLSLLRSMFNFWNEVFKDSLGHSERSFVSEMMTMRNDFAHEKHFSSEDTYRALDTAGRLLLAVSALKEAESIDAMRRELIWNVYAELRDPVDYRNGASELFLGRGEEEYKRHLVAAYLGDEIDGTEAALDVGKSTHQRVDGMRANSDANAARYGSAGSPH